MVLRKELFWSREMKDDKVVEPFFEIGVTHTEDDWGLQARSGGGEGGAYVWEPPCTTSRTSSSCTPPSFEVDEETTSRDGRAGAGDLRGPAGDPSGWRLVVEPWPDHGSRALAGAGGDHVDMVDRPADPPPDEPAAGRHPGEAGPAGGAGAAEPELGQYVGSGGFGYTGELPSGMSRDPVQTAQMWGFCESQETVGVSPDMFAEFIFPYQLPLMERFGLNCYGCCEPLDVRWPVVRQAPNLRRVSVSSWANAGKMAANLEDRYVFSWKPSPAPLASNQMDERTVRAAIRATLDAARGCRLEIVMKDNHTLGHNPRNAVRWVEIAREEIDRVAT